MIATQNDAADDDKKTNYPTNTQMMENDVYDSYYDFPIKSSLKAEQEWGQEPIQPIQSIQSIQSEPKEKELSYKMKQYKPRTEPFPISMLLNKNNIINLVHGYIKEFIWTSSKKKEKYEYFRFEDILNLISLYINERVFLWRLSNDKKKLKEIYGAPNDWPFELKLHITVPYNTETRSYKGWTKNIYEQSRYSKAPDLTKYADIYLEFYQEWNRQKGKGIPSFIKIYYELSCNEMDKLHFWKGTKKWAFFDIKKKNSKSRKKNSEEILYISHRLMLDN